MMRFKSKTNSRKHENLPLRRAYADENPIDEIASLFPEYVPGYVKVPTNEHGGFQMIEINPTANQVHHISGGVLGTKRWDIVTNLCHCGYVTHRFCETYQRDGYAICMAAKLHKGEWDENEIRRIVRFDSSMGWLEAGRFAFDWPKQVLRDAIVRFQEVRS